MPNSVSRPRGSTALTDYFLHESFYADVDVLHRARVLISALYAFAGFTLAAIPFVLGFLPLTFFMQLTVTASCASTAFAFIYLLFILKQHGRYKFCAGIAIAIPVAAITTSLCLTGGISQSPATQLLVLQPLIAFFFAGVRGGCVATLVIGILMAVMIALHQAGIDPPQWMQPGYQGPLWLALLLIGFFVIAVTAVVYEFTSTALRRERDNEHAKVVKLANTDSLTGLANRRAFDASLHARIEAYRQRQDLSQFALCYLDLDGFKPINDQHGHDVGDQVLRTVAIRLRSALRGADLVGRQGGDEFMLLLNGLGANQVMELLAQRFISMIRQPIETSAGLVSVGASLGFALYPHHADSVEKLKKVADAAMYAAKRDRAGWRLYAAYRADDNNKHAPPI